jgi:hypothetical protein
LRLVGNGLSSVKTLLAHLKAMATMFEDLMTGLDEVDAFLAGEKYIYRVNLPVQLDEIPTALIDDLHPQLER